MYNKGSSSQHTAKEIIPMCKPEMDSRYTTPAWAYASRKSFSKYCFWQKLKRANALSLWKIIY